MKNIGVKLKAAQLVVTEPLLDWASAKAGRISASYEKWVEVLELKREIESCPFCKIADQCWAPENPYPFDLQQQDDRFGRNPWLDDRLCPAHAVKKAGENPSGLGFSALLQYDELVNEWKAGLRELSTVARFGEPCAHLFVDQES